MRLFLNARLRVVLGAILLLICRGALAAPDILTTPAGKAMTEWLSAFNSGDAQQIRAFARAYHRDVSVEDTLAARWAIGGYDVLRIEASQESVLTALLKEKLSDRAVRMEVAVEPGAPATLKLQGRFVPLPPEFAPARMAIDDAVDALSRRADELCVADRFSGAILVARDSKVLSQQACGMADRTTKAPVTTDSQFRIGSLNKMFTAVAVLQLIEAGKISLDGSLQSILPDHPNRDVASKITVRHLLTHTAGTGDIFGPDFDARKAQLKEHADYVRLYADRALEYQPGTSSKYSNYGYVLLGAVIEKISGRSYYDYVRTSILEPAGMNATGSLPESTSVPGRTPAT